VQHNFHTLGADGFGFSDTRPAARRFFKIDGPSIVVKTLQALAAEGAVDRSLAVQAMDRYALHDVSAGTSGNAGGES
jgi:pyruvate dehydrogenase E1 component